MRPDEMLVARLARGATIVRYVSETSTRVSVALGRNRQARVPQDRILLATGAVASTSEQAEQFALKCQQLASDIDLVEVWEVVEDSDGPLALEDLADLYWDSPPNASQMSALAIHLDGDTDRFERGKEGYQARPRAGVEEIQARRRREAENRAATSSLMDGLARGSVPEPLTPHQDALLRHLTGYAVDGEDYPRQSAARQLLEFLPDAGGDPQRLTFDLLVSAGVFSPHEPLELHRAGIREHFSAEALAEADALKGQGEPGVTSGRRDLTHLEAFTIDDAGTLDRDDALSLESGPSEGIAYRVGVHIADAGALVPSGGPMDEEADRRMATLYLPERTVPMLPPRFAQGSGSLEQEAVRRAVSLLVDLDESGNISEWEVTPSVVQSQGSLTYEQADAAIADETGRWNAKLSELERIARRLRQKRVEAGAVDLEQPEMALRVGRDAEVEVRVLQRSSPSRRLVAELMIMCNRLLGEFCRREELPAVYRSQAAPDMTGLELEATRLSANDAGAILARFLLIRKLRSADLDTVPSPHHGLGVPVYVQASSPLRRYPDLVMQRQISHFLSHGESLYPMEKVASVLQRAEVQIRELAHIEESRKRYWFLKYLQQSQLEGDEPALFDAVVLETSPGRRALLELTEFPFRFRAEVSGDRFPGEVVSLRLQGVDLWRRLGHFVETQGRTVGS